MLKSIVCHLADDRSIAGRSPIGFNNPAPRPGRSLGRGAGCESSHFYAKLRDKAVCLVGVRADAFENRLR
jgi:hypothetical protein